MSVDSSFNPFNRTILPTELQAAIASIAAPNAFIDDPADEPRQPRARRPSVNRLLFNPSLPTIEEEEHDDVLQFIQILVH